MRQNRRRCFNKHSDWHNVEKGELFGPVHVMNWKDMLWRLTNNSTDQHMPRHVLAPLGASTVGYLGNIKKLWRACNPDARAHITLPHPHHNHYLNGSKLLRPITRHGMGMFFQAHNQDLRRNDEPDTLPGTHLGFNFAISPADSVPDEPLQKLLQRKEMRGAMAMCNNFIIETAILLPAVKDDA